MDKLDEQIIEIDKWNDTWKYLSEFFPGQTIPTQSIWYQINIFLIFLYVQNIIIYKKIIPFFKIQYVPRESGLRQKYAFYQKIHNFYPIITKLCQHLVPISTVKPLLEHVLLFNSQILERASIQVFQNFI